MRPIDEICGAVDDALGRASFTRTSDGFLLRTYETVLDGMTVQASLSVLIDTGAPHRLTSGMATGYDFQITCMNGLPTRYLIGRDLPLLLGLGMSSLDAAAYPGCTARVDDLPWFESHLRSPAAHPALAGLAAHASFIEQRPGALQVRLTRIGNTDLPPLDEMLRAFATVVRASGALPPPRPAAARLSDNRTLMMALVTVVVLGGFAGCVGSYYALVR